MLGFDSNYVPGWDCHGLPIEWKIEEENYRAKGKPKPDLSDPAALVEFRKECRAFAEHWIDVQREEFERLGVVGDWAHPYTTMDFYAEAQIARELMKFAANGTLYRGSKPVMWSVVEKTALAEAEVEYEDYTSDTVWVKFPITGTRARTGEGARDLRDSSIVIWTTTPWTIPGNSAVSYSAKIEYAVFEVTRRPGRKLGKVRAISLCWPKKLAIDVMRQARVLRTANCATLSADELGPLICSHPLHGFADNYDFDVPLLKGDHVTDDVGTGFVHTAPGHGREDFDVWTANARELAAQGIDTDHSLHRRRRRPLHRAGARFHRQARAHRQRREGRRQRRGDQGLDRCRHAARARAAQASISALVALEKAGHLPQHAAMVHRHGPSDCAVERQRKARPDAAPACGRGDQGDALGAGAGRAAYQRHDREQARLGDLAPARLGRADHASSSRKIPTARSRFSTIPTSMPASSTLSRQRAPTPGTRRARASASSASSATKAGRRSTTFSMSGSIPARRTPSCWKTPEHFPGARAHQAQGRRRRRSRDVSRRLRPAPRLVPVLAA